MMPKRRLPQADADLIREAKRLARGLRESEKAKRAMPFADAAKMLGVRRSYLHSDAPLTVHHRGDLVALLNHLEAWLLWGERDAPHIAEVLESMARVIELKAARQPSLWEH